MAIKNITDIDGQKSLSTTVGGSYGTDNQTASIYMDTTSGRGLSGNFSGYARNIIKSNGTNTIHIGDNTAIISRILIDAGSTGTNGYISLNTKQVERMRIHSGGNVSIGTTNAYAKLSVYASSHNNGIAVNRQADTTAALYIGNDGGNNPVLAANNADMLFGKDVSSTFTEYMRLTTSGTLKFAGSTNGGELYADDFGLKVGTSSGYIQFGPANTSWAHIYTDRPAFYFNKELYVNNAQVATRSWVTGQGYLTSVPSHQHTDADINSWHNRETVNIDTYNPDSNWSTSIATSTSYGTQPSNYTNIHNLGGDGVDFQTQIATYYGNNNRMWVRSRYDGTNAWVGWNEVWTSGSFANNSANWDTAYSWGDHAAAGYLTSYSETDTLATVVARGAYFGTTNQGYVASGGTYGSELRKIRRITLTSGGSNWDGDNHAILSEDISGATTDSISINSYNGIHLRLDSNNNQANNLTNFTIHNDTTTNTNELFRVTGAGNVGIGTTSPAAKLHVDGNVRFVDAGFAGFEAHNTNGNWESFIGTETGGGGNRYNSKSSQHTFYNNSTAVMRINSSGNVGIGTTSPAGKLEVSGSSLTELKVTESGSSVTTMVQSSTSYGWIGTKTNHTMYIGANDGAKMTIQPNGNVGIGTTSPAYTLDVNGSMHSTNITIADAIYHEGDTNTVIGFGTDTINLSTGGGVRATINNNGTKFNNDVVVVGGATLSLGEAGEPDDLGRTVLIEGVANASNGEGSGRIFFSENNNTATNLYGLSLYYEGDPNAQLPSGFQPNTGNATWSLRRHDNNSNGIAIMSGSRTNSNVQFGGSITIGSGVTLSESTDRADLLSVTSSTNGWGGLQITNTAGEGIWSFMVDDVAAGIHDDQNGDWAVYCVENSYVQLRHNGTGKLTTSSVGVDVAGRIYLSANDSHIEFNTSASSGNPKIQMGADADFSFVNTAGSTNLHIENGGNVGIGTTSPSEKLEVSGNILASGDITAFSDARLKENVETLPNALESVKAMRGVTYNKIGEEKQSIGVIAQEVQAVLPQLVSEHGNEMLSVAYGNITAVLIEAIKEQQKQIDELKAIINGLTK